MKQNFRVAIKRTGIETTHYIVRTEKDKESVDELIWYLVNNRDDLELIKWVPIPKLEEVKDNAH